MGRNFSDGRNEVNYEVRRGREIEEKGEKDTEEEQEIDREVDRERHPRSQKEPISLAREIKKVKILIFIAIVVQ